MESEASRSGAPRAVKGPATALLVISAASLLSSLAILGLLAVGVSLRRVPQGEVEVLTAFSGYVGIALSAFNALVNAVILVGAAGMLKGRRYGLAMAAAVLALVPCTSSMLCCCCAGILNIPFGIWALVVLSRPEVRAAFRRPRT